MAGISADLFERVFAETDVAVAIDSPVMYEVWREYALRGPTARRRLLLRLADDANARDVARRLNQTAEMLDITRAEAVGVIGEWLLVRADLEYLVRVLLPQTRWGRLLAIIGSLPRGTLEELLAPLEELLARTGGTTTPRSDGAETPSDTGQPGTPLQDDSPPRLQFSQRDQEIASWLLRLLARVWGYDADLDSERELAAANLSNVYFAEPPSGLTSAGHATVESISLDRRAVPANVASSTIVKADAARRLFETSAAGQTWAIIDGGINASHPAFRDDSGVASRIDETFDLSSIADSDLELRDLSKGPIDHLVDVVQLSAVAAWRKDSDSPYVEPVTSHGTHVAGILAGSIPGVYEGVCPDLRIWDFRVLGSSAEGNESRVLMALRFIRHVNERDREIRIAGANMSISLGYNPKNHACGWTPVCEEVRRLVRSGVVVVAAAGNSGYQSALTLSGSASATATGTSKGSGFTMVSVTDPGNTEEAITVGSTHALHPYRYGTSYFSGRGPTADGRSKPDLLAPGEHITGPIGRNKFVSLDGTSQAAPHVAGAAAILMARYPELIGQPERVKQILCNTATDLGRDKHFQGHGLVDVLRAAQSV